MKLRRKKYIQNLVGKFGKKLLARPRGWKDNIKINLEFPLTSGVSWKVCPHDAQPQRDQGPSQMKTA
jgi:hypothetical protein